MALFGGSRLAKNLVLLVFSCSLLFKAVMCRVAVASRAGRGVGGLVGGGRGHVTVVMKCLQVHEHTCQCTQVDAWRMLVADAGKKGLRATVSITASMNLLEESL